MSEILLNEPRQLSYNFGQIIKCRSAPMVAERYIQKFLAYRIIEGQVDGGMTAKKVLPLFRSEVQHLLM
jgi:hypothetical protein